MVINENYKNYLNNIIIYKKLWIPNNKYMSIWIKYNHKKYDQLFRY